MSIEYLPPTPTYPKNRYHVRPNTHTACAIQKPAPVGRGRSWILMAKSSSQQMSLSGLRKERIATIH